MAILKRHKSSIHGLVSELSALDQAILDEAQLRASQVGDLEELETEEQGSLVEAINEVLSTATSGEGSLKIDQNLGDLADVEAARGNLDVLSSQEVKDAIAVAGVELGTNFTVADTAARDALEGLDDGDRVLVLDVDNTGKWAIFAPVAFDEGVVTDWAELFNEDVLTNSMTAEGVKIAYESNDDTNAFTDAEKAKLANAVTTGDVVAEVDPEAEDLEDTVPSAAALVNYVATHAPVTPSVVPVKETLVVDGSTITLSNEPKGGINGILNFATVRYVDGEGIAYDAPVLATAEAKEFTISTDTAGQWDGFSVQVQYLHEA